MPGRHDIDRAHRKGGLIRSGIRGLSGAVGLASESIKAHKGNKEASQTITELPPPEGQISVHDETHQDILDQEWDLDDAQDEPETNPPPQGFPEETTTEEAFLQNQPSIPVVTGRLPLPVVLPQRRPKDRSRGFIRAYAPVLESVGIDQPTWLDFLNTLENSSAADPWLSAINLAQFATFALPSTFAWAVGMAIAEFTKITIEAQSRYRTTKALHKINEEFFQPRGLYCLIMTWNPDSDKKVEKVNIADTIASRTNPRSGLKGATDKYRASDGKTYGDVAFPEVAPLVFPSLDHLAGTDNPEAAEKKSALAKEVGFVKNYYDKRATAEYVMLNPNSPLSQVPQREFNSRYADPNHPASSGSLISFVSGGHLVPGPNSRGLISGLISVAGQAARGEKQGSEWKKYDERQKDGKQQRRYQSEGRKGIISTPLGQYKKLFKNVLYLLVVNMPSEEEIAAAKAAC